MGSTIGIQRGLTPSFLSATALASSWPESTTILGAGRHGAVLTTTLAALDIGKSTSRSSKLMRLGSYGSDAGSSACTEWRER